MALSGNVSTNSYDGRYFKLSWSATQSVANNTSTISWTLSAVGGNSSWYSTGSIKCIINGTTVYSYSGRRDMYTGTIDTGKITITHNSSGEKSFTVKIEAAVYDYSVNCTASKTFTLNTIARASTITSASNVTLNASSSTACNIKWTPASEKFYYKLKFSLAGSDWSHTTGALHPETTSQYTYNSSILPSSLIDNYIKTSTKGTITVVLYTYSNSSLSNQIGSSSSKTFTVTVPSSIKPTLSNVVFSLVNTNSVIDGWGLAVANYTKVKITASASGVRGSTIKSFTISGGYNVTKTETSLDYTGNIITSSGDKTFTVIVTDSRGRESTATSEVINFLSYNNPNISLLSVQRSQTAPTRMIAEVDWTYRGMGTPNQNNSTGVLYYKKTSSNTWTQYNTSFTTSDRMSYGGSPVLLNVVFSETDSYNFKLIVTDLLGGTAEFETRTTTASVLMNFKAGGKGLGIGKVAETNSLEVAFPAKFEDTATFLDAATFSGTANFTNTSNFSNLATFNTVKINTITDHVYIKTGKDLYLGDSSGGQSILFGKDYSGNDVRLIGLSGSSYNNLMIGQDSGGSVGVLHSGNTYINSGAGGNIYQIINNVSYRMLNTLNVKSGNETLVASSQTGTVTKNVSFGTNFDSTPVVIAQVVNVSNPSNVAVSISSKTTSGFRINLIYTGSSSNTNINVSWIALGAANN